MNFKVDVSEHSAWVNGQAHCMGRFNKNNYEIYSPDYRKPPLVTQRTGDNLLLDWIKFKDLILKHHGIELTRDEQPFIITRLQDQATICESV